MKLGLVKMSLEYGLYPSEADFSSLLEFFPDVNLRKICEVESFHKNLSRILDSQFTKERQAIEKDISMLEARLQVINEEIKSLGLIGNLSKEFLDKHSALKSEIEALKAQNRAYLTLRELTSAKAKADEELKRNIEGILFEIEKNLNTKMKEINDSLFSTSRKPPYIHFYGNKSYVFETPDDTGTGSNYKGMIVYDLAILSCTALPAIAHDSLLFKNLSKEVEEGIIKAYDSFKKQIFIAYDKQGDCSSKTQNILNKNMRIQLTTDGGELYGRAWNKEEIE